MTTQECALQKYKYSQNSISDPSLGVSLNRELTVCLSTFRPTFGSVNPGTVFLFLAFLCKSVTAFFNVGINSSMDAWLKRFTNSFIAAIPFSTTSGFSELYNKSSRNKHFGNLFNINLKYGYIKTVPIFFTSSPKLLETKNLPWDSITWLAFFHQNIAPSMRLIVYFQITHNFFQIVSKIKNFL